ncbi:DUF3301 domain-containing protein [Alloalcanivorax gelatiniphagus]|uniref:DUF3301 domain-containing protein n=1 Tax=Alloalcanivorax gelatiniphagus TaxID=1194167 RepID=A0ABY2XI21_9GAMM|nr:DUF3301 domain-containing protein [Alloalcanivorax gelatiniphagus]TMW11411.1 DUF3301 domain-containing protein [Alloalcanivorax gelatiniphagus]
MNLALTDILLLAALVIMAALFWRAQRIRETALRATRRHCEQEQVLLLDQTVGLKRLRPRRDEHGRLRLWRLYEFEFTVTGGERYKGETEVLGERVRRVVLPPHRFTREPDQLH